MSEQPTKQIIETNASIKPSKLFLWIIGIALGIMVLVFWNYFHHFNGPIIYKQDVWGQFGDYIGGTLNPILSFLSLIALLWTIGIQSKDLELTRDELKRSAKAQEDTKAILDKQSETLARQQFESTFFSLLDQHNKVMESLTRPRTDQHGTVLTDVIYNLRFYSSSLIETKRHLISQNEIFGNYFRVLYQLLKFIATNAPGSTIGKAFEASEIKNENASDDEKIYTNIVRSFLGDEITQLLSINCVCENNSEDTYWRYKLLIEKYSFLEHMSFKTYPGVEEVFNNTIDYYEPRVFGGNSYVKEYREGKAFVQSAFEVDSPQGNPPHDEKL